MNDTTEVQLSTQEMGHVDHVLLHQSLVQTWVKTFQAAETMHLCLHPTYVRHSEEELVGIIERALLERRGPSQMIAQILADGSRGLARTLEPPTRSRPALRSLAGPGATAGRKLPTRRYSR